MRQQSSVITKEVFHAVVGAQPAVIVNFATADDPSPPLARPDLEIPSVGLEVRFVPEAPGQPCLVLRALLQVYCLQVHSMFNSYFQAVYRR